MDNKTIILALDVAGTCKDLSVFLGLGPEAVVGPFNSAQFMSYEKQSPTLFKIGVDSRDEAMAIFKESHIRLMFWPPGTMVKVPEIQLDSKYDVPLWQIYEHCQQYGTVVTVLPGKGKHGSIKRLVYYTVKEAAQHAFTEMSRKPPQINGITLEVSVSKLNASLPDFWVPSKAPEKTEKARGNLIDVPTNNTRATSGSHVLPGQQAPNKPKNQSGAVKSNPLTILHKNRRVIGSAEDQRAFKTLSRISIEELSLQPGEIKGASCNPHLFETSMKTWCETAFICYETLHNLSSDSNQGTVHTSTLTWGSQLDISTFRMHYGEYFMIVASPIFFWQMIMQYDSSIIHPTTYTRLGSSFTPSGTGRQYPVLSSLTVEMRQYGDKDSAAGVLAIRNNGQLPDSCDSSLTEGINVTTRAPVLSMKCLESGHLVASSGSRNTDYTLQVWDMRDQREKAEVPVAMYVFDSPQFCIINIEVGPKLSF
ncbi:hypothetical protein BGX26_000549 [Mortierella sp. AD094]|nr:hypothetical protein BGX26_000549 [Mortierella sp. AD094]